MPAFNELTAASRRFFDKVGGFTEFSVDAFDAFMIEEGLVSDPETDDSSDPRYKGFVQQRGVIKNKIDRAAKHIPNGEAYAIKVKNPGVTWELIPLHTSMDEQYRDFAADAAARVKNSMNRLRLVEKAMREKLLDEHDYRLQQVLSINSLMTTEAIGFTSQVKGLAARYDAAYSKAQELVAQLAADAGVEIQSLEHYES